MKKNILLIIAAFLSVSNYTHIYSAEKWDKPIIIPRASWGANSLYNDREWLYWEPIIKARSEYKAPSISEQQAKKNKEKNKKIEEYLYWNFLDQFTSTQTLYTKQDWEYTFAWPLKYTDKVDAIVIHHTSGEYEDTITWLQNIHKFHSLSRQWWDVWYHYIIWYDGEIFEWREWWDYVVGAHSKYNNFGTVWIAMIWDYHEKWINTKQYESLESLVWYLIKKYWIDINKKRYYHRTCSWEKCNTFPIETYLDDSLVWHRDATHTSCPWEELYKQIQQIHEEYLDFSRWLKPVIKWAKEIPTNVNTSVPKIQTFREILRKYSAEQLQLFLKVIDNKQSKTINIELKQNLQILRLAIILNLKEI